LQFTKELLKLRTYLCTSGTFALSTGGCTSAKHPEEENGVASFIYIKRHGSNEEFISVENICSVHIAREGEGASPFVMIHLSGAPTLKLEGLEATKFLDIFNHSPESITLLAEPS